MDSNTHFTTCECVSIKECFEKRLEKKNKIFCGRGDVCGSKNEFYIILHISEEMRFYVNRLESFYDWPISQVIDPHNLAVNGFYYLHNKDYVRCAFCGVRLKEWESMDYVEHEHRKFSPNCPFINSNLEDDNIPGFFSNAAILQLIATSSVYNEIGENVQCKICKYKFVKASRNWTDVDNDHFHWSNKCPYVQFMQRKTNVLNPEMAHTFVKEEYVSDCPTTFVPKNESFDQAEQTRKEMRRVKKELHRAKQALTYLLIKDKCTSDPESYELLAEFDRWYENTRMEIRHHSRQSEENKFLIDWLEKSVKNAENTLNVLSRIIREYDPNSEEFFRMNRQKNYLLDNLLDSI